MFEHLGVLNEVPGVMCWGTDEGTLRGLFSHPLAIIFQIIKSVGLSKTFEGFYFFNLWIDPHFSNCVPWSVILWAQIPALTGFTHMHPGALISNSSNQTKDWLSQVYGDHFLCVHPNILRWVRMSHGNRAITGAVPPSSYVRPKVHVYRFVYRSVGR